MQTIPTSDFFPQTLSQKHLNFVIKCSALLILIDIDFESWKTRWQQRWHFAAKIIPVNKIPVINFHSLTSSVLEFIILAPWKLIFVRKQSGEEAFWILRQCSKYNFNHIFIIICIIMENYFGAWRSWIASVECESSIAGVVRKLFDCLKSEVEETPRIAELNCTIEVPLGSGCF